MWRDRQTHRVSERELDEDGRQTQSGRQTGSQAGMQKNKLAYRKTLTEFLEVRRTRKAK